MKVLVVEAEEATLKGTGIMLNKLGYQSWTNGQLRRGLPSLLQ
jgi:putative AlgH/UPF0301 family transcriptional regulator